MRQPRSDLGKGLLIAVEQVEMETPAIFASMGMGAGSSWPVGMRDFLEGASVEDLAKTLRA